MDAEETIYQAAVDSQPGMFLTLRQEAGGWQLQYYLGCFTNWEVYDLFSSAEVAMASVPGRWRPASRPGSTLNLAQLFSDLFATGLSGDMFCALAWLAYSRIVLDSDGFPISATDGYCWQTHRVVAGMLDELLELWDGTPGPCCEPTWHSTYECMLMADNTRQAIEASPAMADLLQRLSRHPGVSAILNDPMLEESLDPAPPPGVGWLEAVAEVSLMRLLIQMSEARQTRLQVLTWPDRLVYRHPNHPEPLEVFVALQLGQAGLGYAWLAKESWLVVGTDKQLADWAVEVSFGDQVDPELAAELRTLYPGAEFALDPTDGMLDMRGPVGVMKHLHAELGNRLHPPARSSDSHRLREAHLADYVDYLKRRYNALKAEADGSYLRVAGLPYQLKAVSREVFDLDLVELGYPGRTT